MSTEYEGTEGPAQQSATPATPPVPPVPPVAPDGPPPGPVAGPPPVAPPGPEVSAPVPPAAAPAPEAGPPAPASGLQTPGPTAPPVAPPAPQHGADWAVPPAAPPALPPYGGPEGPVWGAPVPPGAAAPKRRKRFSSLAVAVLVAALVAGGVGGAAGYWAASDRDEDSSSTTITSTEIPKDLKREPGSVASVAAKALPSVVTIEAKSGREGGADLPGGGSGGGTGTGFVYDQQGHILTNNHVVASAAEGGTVAVTFSDGRKYDAEVIGRAQGYDVAVLKLKNAPSGLTPLPLGDSGKVAVGDSTIAIGAPFGLSNTVTTGIISAKNRPVASGGEASSKSNSYMSALQTDASINPGNSGGPLLDARGAVIGINSAIQSTGNALGQAGSIGLGFAIPINQAKNVAEQLIKTGKPVYPVIGATVDVSEAAGGARIPLKGNGDTPAVPPTGPAAKAGLKAGDVITEFNGKPIDSGPTLISEIWNHKPGDKITLTYERDGKKSKANLVLGSRTGDS
ncbi:S1C family serine protease [Streptomyces qinzhouensis]|uniref:PDZ domain-containing protein n=1 Tax=Streptomyces qinzhouensis TaxID=2599401 RepID=A0A5B8JIX1_9ACTN|nr:trypsin-like peptidase domain-containing protein [Streptomyces qinzhouensis]QDY77760.1 PDZ domain-containing protein [Streptomyces qinzhouensis]